MYYKIEKKPHIRGVFCFPIAYKPLNFYFDAGVV